MPEKNPQAKNVKICSSAWAQAELRTLAIIWTHFCVDRTADLGSSVDTFLMLRKLKKLLDPVGKVSIKLLRSGSFLSILSTKKRP